MGAAKKLTQELTRSKERAVSASGKTRGREIVRLGEGIWPGEPGVTVGQAKRKSAEPPEEARSNAGDGGTGGGEPA